MFDKSKIKVYNYARNFISFETKNNRAVSFDPCLEFNHPVMEYMTFDEVEYTNSHSNVFRVGRLEFDENNQDEIYGQLNIIADECLYERDIDKLIEFYTKENVQKILSVKHYGTIERIRGHVVMHQELGDIDIPSRMISLVSARYQEISNGIMTTAILVTDSSTDQQGNTVSMDEVQKLLDEQRKEILAAVAISKEATEPKANGQTELVTPEAENDEKESIKPTGKRGRPAGSKVKA